MSLKIQNLDLMRGGRLLQSAITLSLNAGEAVWLRGPNGVGKSTLLETLCGLRRPSAGQILWKDVSIAEDADDFHASMAYCGHKNANSPALTVERAIGFYAELYDVSADKADMALNALGLSTRKDIPVHYLSTGQQRRLALARLLLVDAKLWILDEPTVSLDQEGASQIADLIDAHCQAGGMAIFTSHINLGCDCRELILKPISTTERNMKDEFLGSDWEGVA